MNAIFTINVYKEGSTWYFDDNHRDIIREPFVLGASELITYLVGADKQKATISFSESAIPNPDLVLTCTTKCHPHTLKDITKSDGKVIPSYEEDKTLEPESGWYVDQNGNICWLCPAQLKFFNKVADTIFIKVI
jgi:hypothetical protein